MIIDNPLRASQNNQLVKDKHIALTKISDNIIGKQIVSLHNKDAFLGECKYCVDQCGVPKLSLIKQNRRLSKMLKQAELFPDEVEFIQVDSVIGSGYENDVAALGYT